MLEEIKAQLDVAISRADSALMEGFLGKLEQLSGNEAKALTLRVKGLLAYFKGDLEGAARYFEEALQNPPEDLHVKAVILVNMGSIKQELGEAELALGFFHEALELYAQIEDGVGEARLLGNMGNLFTMIGETVTALSYYEQALDLHRRIGDDSGEARVTANIAIQFAQAAEFEKALSYLQKSKTICEKLGNRAMVGHISTNIGEVFSDLGRHQESFRSHQEALNIYEEIGNQTQVRRVLGNYAKALLVAGNPESAQEMINKVDVSLAEADIKIMLHWVQGKIYLNSNKLAEAKETLEKIMQEVRQSGNQFWSQKILNDLREVAKQMADFEAYVSLNEELASSESSMEGKKTAQRLAVMEKEHELKILQENSKRQRDLLFSTLPAGVAVRMLQGEDVSGDEFSSAAVMFCDIVGFTNESKRLSPRKVTQILEEIFEEFDAICTESKITKVKTIGDAYLAVALEHENQTTVERVASAALKMSSYETQWPDGAPVILRFGLHCGPVIAGVIGSQRFQYDIWGDTVNFASRLENACEPGRILISERFAKELPPSHADIQEGPILELKGLGEQKTYLLK